MLRLDQVEALLASDALVVDACRHAVRAGSAVIALARRPVLFALARALASAWPGDVPRDVLLARLFRARHADASHRVRLRVEVGRLRAAIRTLATLKATPRGFVLQPLVSDKVEVLLPPQESGHGRLLALLADGEAWASSALAMALDVSPRTVQRALAALAAEGQVERLGRGRSHRWIVAGVPANPTSLLLPALASGDIE